MFAIEFISRKQLDADPEDAVWTRCVQSYATEPEAEQEKAWLELEGSDTVYRVRPAWLARSAR